MFNNQLIRYSIRTLTMLMLSAVSTLAAEETSSPPAANQGMEFSRFESILKNNIFNPRRSPRTARPVVQEVTRAEPEPIRLSLMGTLVQSDRAYAFFDGSQSQYNSIQQVGGSLAGLTIRQITAQGVICDSSNGTVEINVGRGIEIRQDGSWIAVSQPARSQSSAATQISRPRTDAEAAPAPASAGSPSAPAGDSSQSDVLRRLRERRQQEGR